MKRIAYLIAGVAAVAAVPVAAKDITVEMRNKGPEGAMVFVPAFVKASPGDRIRFVPTDPSHNAESIPTMLPAGASPLKGAMNKEALLTVTKPGVYGIKCLPHFGMGMVALVQVGKGPSANLAAAKAAALPPFAKKRMDPLLAQAR